VSPDVKQCPECASLRTELAKAEGTFRPRMPGGRYEPDGSALTDARVKIRRHEALGPNRQEAA
jgi:hypothetical protein